MIVIVDYGLGNVGSVANMLRKVTQDQVQISANPDEIRKAGKLILPGVGHFDRGMENLHKRGLLPALQEKVVNERTPILGICLGMQLMSQKSEEGGAPGLGWIEANFKRFSFSNGTVQKVPHMGWNWVRFLKLSPLTRTIPENSRFYFVHSYHCAGEQREDVLAECDYGYEFTAAFQKENIFGVQFHPEKSHRFGLELLRGFASL